MVEFPISMLVCWRVSYSRRWPIFTSSSNRAWVTWRKKWLPQLLSFKRLRESGIKGSSCRGCSCISDNSMVNPCPGGVAVWWPSQPVSRKPAAYAQSNQAQADRNHACLVDVLTQLCTSLHEWDSIPQPNRKHRTSGGLKLIMNSSKIQRWSLTSNDPVPAMGWVKWPPVMVGYYWALLQLAKHRR